MRQIMRKRFDLFFAQLAIKAQARLIAAHVVEARGGEQGTALENDIAVAGKLLPAGHLRPAGQMSRIITRRSPAG